VSGEKSGRTNGRREVVAKYRKKPVVIEAVQLLHENWNEICEHANVGSKEDKPNGVYLTADGMPHDEPPGDVSLDDLRLGLRIPTLEGVMIGEEGDWIIKGVQGEIYPCKPDIFAATYEPVGG
jgi:hypothetical protein